MTADQTVDTAPAPPPVDSEPLPGADPNQIIQPPPPPTAPNPVAPSLYQSKIDKLRAGGFSQQEINDWTIKTGGRLLAAGFNQNEVNDYLGIKSPDMSGIHRMVQDNVPTQNEGEPPKTFQEVLDHTLGMKVTLGDDQQNQPLSAAMRAHLMDAYKNGSAHDAGDFMQSAVPYTTGLIDSAALGSYKTAASLSLIYKQFMGEDEAVKKAKEDMQIASQIQQELNAQQGVAGRLGYNLAAATPSVAVSLLVGRMSNPILGLASFGLTSGSQEYAEAVSRGTPPQKAALAGAAVGAINLASGAVPLKYFTQALGKAGFGEFLTHMIGNAVPANVAAQVASSAADKSLTQPETTWKDWLKQQPENVANAIVGAVAFSGAGAAYNAVHPHLANLVAAKTGKDASAVTKEDVDTEVGKSFRKAAPSAQEFLDYGLTMTGDVAKEQAAAQNLRDVYAKTGVPPSQVAEDASRNPAITAEVLSGKVPEAYSHLVDESFKPVPPEGVQYTDLDPSSKAFAVEKNIAARHGIDLQPYPKEGSLLAPETEKLPEPEEPSAEMKQMEAEAGVRIQHAPSTEEFADFAADHPQTPDGMRQAARDFVIKKGQETGNEHLVALDESGSASHHVEGGKDYIKIPEDLAKKLEDPNSNFSLIHNHPRSVGTSPKDISILGRPGAANVVAHTPEGRVAKVKLTQSFKDETGILNSDERREVLLDIGQKAFDLSKDLIQKEVNSGKLNPDGPEESLAKAHNEIFNKTMEESGVTHYEYDGDHSDALPPNIYKEIYDKTASYVKERLEQYGFRIQRLENVEGRAGAGVQEGEQNRTPVERTSGYEDRGENKIIASEARREPVLRERNPAAPARETLSEEHSALEDNMGVPEDMSRSQLGKLDRKIGRIFSNEGGEGLPKAEDLTDPQFEALEEYARRVEDAMESLGMTLREEIANFKPYTADELADLIKGDPEGYAEYASAHRAMDQYYRGERPDMPVDKARKILDAGADKFERAFAREDFIGSPLSGTGESTSTPIRNMAEAASAIKNSAENTPSLVDKGHKLVNDLIYSSFNITKDAFQKYAPENLQNFITDAVNEVLNWTLPMETGTVDARASAKKFANDLRLIQYKSNRLFDYLTKNYPAKDLEAMWVAMDKASVQAQTDMANGMERSEAINKAKADYVDKLNVAQKRIIEELNKWQQETWKAATDLGMVRGEGLPFWTPRMAASVGMDGKYGNYISGEGGRPEINPIGRNLKTSASSLKGRKHLTAEDTEKAMQDLAAKFGKDAKLVKDIRTMVLSLSRVQQAIAGKSLINEIRRVSNAVGYETVKNKETPGYFTLDHPAFKTWRPDFVEGEDGKSTVVKDENGDVVFVPDRLYVSNKFKGPLMAVLGRDSGPVYKALMTLKSKTTGLIMYSPFIHNAVEWGRTLPIAPLKTASGIIYFEGNAAKHDPETMTRAIQHGLVPMGRHFERQDISSIAEGRTLEPGKSWTAKILGGLVGHVNEQGGENVKRVIDTLGDWYHNKLLWDRIADLQMGIYKNMENKALKQGYDADSASIFAAHMANRYAGAIPLEAMSNFARKSMNLALFSRSFTSGNLGIMKDMIVGLPSDVKAQLETLVGKDAAESASRYAQRKAIVGYVMDLAITGVLATSLVQDAFNHYVRHKSWSSIWNDYVDRVERLFKKIEEHPVKALNFTSNILSLSSTAENEPGKEMRVHTYDEPDGTAQYMRLPTGKVPEEFANWTTHPFEEVDTKGSDMYHFVKGVATNKDFYGHSIYNEDADGLPLGLDKLGAIAHYFATTNLPEDTLISAYKATTGGTDADFNKLKMTGSFTGFTFSHGYPGGPEAGLIAHVKERQKEEISKLLPQVRELVKNKDLDKARNLMDEAGMNKREQRYIIGHYENPASKVNARNLREFEKTATQEEREHMERLLSEGDEDTEP